MNPEALKTFANAAPAAADVLLAQLTPEQASALGAKFHAGARLSLSFAVDPTGEASIVLELIGADGSRQWIAAANGITPAMGRH